MTSIIYVTNNNTIVCAPYIATLLENNKFYYSPYVYTCIECNKKMILKWDKLSDANFVHQVESLCKGSDDKINPSDVENLSWNELDYKCYRCDDVGCDTMKDGCAIGNCGVCSLTNLY